MTTTWFVLTRTVHFGACLLFFGVFGFDRIVAAASLVKSETEAAAYWKSRVQWFAGILLPVILVSGIAWFLLVAANMSGLPLRQAIQSEVLATVWNQTDFGTVWKWRLIFWLAATGATVVFLFKLPLPLKTIAAWIQLTLSALLLGSLAWAGHGVEGPPWHLAADALHLLVLPFALLLRRLRRSSDTGRWHSVCMLVRRFSAMSLSAVALLTATGLVNGWILVGSFANLFGQAYGRWLLAKIILFGVAMAIATVNLLRLKPRLVTEINRVQNAEPTAARLQFNVHMELALGMAIVIIVAILGILPPANH
jgi:copper resistance protein D